MTPGRIACALAVFAAVCVLATFFFTGIEGPYPAVHGPVTALLSIRAAARLRVRIREGLEAMRSWLGLADGELESLMSVASPSVEFPVTIAKAGSVAVLRC
jgi:hypothetical protein